MTRNKENPNASRGKSGSPFRGKATRFLPHSERVKRFYPAATCEKLTPDDDPEPSWYVNANNGTGNILASSFNGEQDAWRRAWTAIESRK